MIAGSIAVLTVLWWPLDLLWMHRGLAGLALGNAIFRSLVLACAAAVWWLAPRFERGERWEGRDPLPLFMLFALVALGVVAYACGLSGNLALPQFQELHLAFLLSVALEVPLAKRTALVGLLCLTTAAGFFVPFPAHLQRPQVAVTFSTMAAMALASVFFGHAVYLLLRRTHTQERALERKADELRRFNETLESRVREQTEELRALAGRLESAHEADHRRIAQELHDELGQELSALGYALAHTQRRYRRAPESIAANLHELATLLDRTRAAARGMVAELRPRLLDDLGLAAAIEWQARRRCQHHGLRLRLELDGDEALLSQTTRTAAFRIFQESLTNVERHSGATSVFVTLALRDGLLLLDVRDDGVGLPRPQTAQRSGLGLVGMRERASRLGGELVVESEPGQGTSVRVRLPIDTAGDAR